MNYNNLFRDSIFSNDITKIKELLENDEFKPSGEFFIQSLVVSCKKEHIEIIKLLLLSGRVNPSDKNNLCIKMSRGYNNFNIIELLWSDQRVKDTLLNDSINLYNELVKIDINKKLTSF